MLALEAWWMQDEGEWKFTRRKRETRIWTRPDFIQQRHLTDVWAVEAFVEILPEKIGIALQ